MPTSGPRRIYLSYSIADRKAVVELKEALINSGFQLSFDRLEAPLGDDRADKLSWNPIVLACVSQAALADRTVLAEWNDFHAQPLTRLIPVYVEETGGELRLPFFLRRLHGVDLYAPGGVERLLSSLEQLAGKAPDATIEETVAGDEVRSEVPRPAQLLIRRISLRDIRCFETFDLELADDDAEPALFTTVLGDNAAGKSTLLRSIALGLSSESDASALIKQLPGAFVRRGAKKGSIRLELCAPENGRELTITTRIEKSGADDERIRKDPDSFPWKDIFVCAYGTNRSRQAAASHEAYTLHQAVISLFNDDTVLLNPEVVLLRQEPRLRSELERRLLSVLMLDEPGYKVTYPRTGIEIHGPWGDHPLLTLSDGYRSTAQWILDFLGWSIYAGRFANGIDVGGILLVDELEQHLHPRWQRYIVQRLRQQFPKTQIFASTHTPLAAAGTADDEGGRLLRLKAAQPEGTITAVELDPSSLAGLRADQVLASEAFGLYTSRSPGSEGDVARYAELLGKKPRTDAEDAEFERLSVSLAAAFQSGESEVEREVERAVEAVLKDRVNAVEPELLELEVRRQLHELFAGDEAD